MSAGWLVVSNGYHEPREVAAAAGQRTNMVGVRGVGALAGSAQACCGQACMLACRVAVDVGVACEYIDLDDPSLAAVLGFLRPTFPEVTTGPRLTLALLGA